MNQRQNAFSRPWVSLLALLLLGFATAQSASAQSASGNFQFSLDDGYTKYVDFAARTQADGTTTGQMTFNDEAPLPVEEVDESGDPPKESSTPVYLKAEFDGMVVDKNMAVMSGTVRDSNHVSYIGQRVLLVVEDNGDDIRNPDKLTWGLYKFTEIGWIPSDAELKDDPGVGMTWIATDAERRDDKGVPYPLKNEPVSYQSFPLASYSYLDMERWAGNIQVQP
jgi:hypothetical protein